MKSTSNERISRLFELAVELDRWLGRRFPSAGVAPTARELVAAFDGLSDWELLQFDGRARGYASPLWDSALWQPRVVSDPSAEGALQRLGAAAPSGFVRQRSLRALATSDQRGAVARLGLIRATDWVAEVRGQALAIVADLTAEAIVDHLALAEHLAASRRRGSTLGETLEAKLRTAEGLKALRAGCRLPDRRTRRSSWRRLLAAVEASSADLSAALDDEDIVVRTIAADAIQKLTATEQRGLASRLRRDPAGYLRARGLAIELELGIASDGELRDALRDRTRAVRSLAQHHWRARGHEPLSVYRQPRQREPTAVDITGVGECGASAEVPWVRQYLAANDAWLRGAALRALARLDPTIGPTAERMLDDPAPNVTSAALTTLRSASIDAATLQSLARRAIEDDRPRVRQSMLALLRPSTWTALETALRAINDPDEAARATAEDELDAWLARSARLTTKPQPDQMDRIKRLLGGAAPAVQRSIEFIIRTST